MHSDTQLNYECPHLWSTLPVVGRLGWIICITSPSASTWQVSLNGISYMTLQRLYPHIMRASVKLALWGYPHQHSLSAGCSRMAGCLSYPYHAWPTGVWMPWSSKNGMEKQRHFKKLADMPPFPCPPWSILCQRPVTLQASQPAHSDE